MDVTIIITLQSTKTKTDSVHNKCNTVAKERKHTNPQCGPIKSKPWQQTCSMLCETN